MLQGLGAGIALPLLDCMIDGPASSLASPTNLGARELPRRSVFIYVPNGVNTLTWQIQSAGKSYRLSDPLKSLEPYREFITPISGLHHPSAIGKGHFCDQVWLTGAKIPEDPANFRNTVSVDQLIAESVGQQTRYPSLELSVTGGSLAWNRNGVSIPAERTPSTVFNRLFKANRKGARAARQKLQSRASILDLIREDTRQFHRAIGANDRSRLEEYLQSVREVELRTSRAEAWLDKPLPEVDSITAAGLTREVAESRAGEYYRTMYDLMVLALRTDMTRVITCMSGSESHALSLPELGINQSRHELSHHNGDPDQLRRLTQCDAFLVEQFSYFLAQLARYNEAGETLLDRTMVLFGSGMSYGHNHGNANLPLVLAGGTSLGVKHGEHLDFNLPIVRNYQLENPKEHYRLCLQPVDSNARMSNLLLSIVQRMGIEQETFADGKTTMF